MRSIQNKATEPPIMRDVEHGSEDECLPREILWHNEKKFQRNNLFSEKEDDISSQTLQLGNKLGTDAPSSKDVPVTLEVFPNESRLKNYIKITDIGTGSFGKVILVKDISQSITKNKKFYVVKTIDIMRLGSKERRDAVNEVRLLGSLKHPYIISYKESFIENGCLCIVMEYADGGDLFQLICRQKQKNQRFSEAQIIRWFTQATLALKHLHDKRILHRDLKSQNMFLMTSGRLCLGDFGIAKVLHRTTAFTKTQIGTPYYLSPEICQNQPYSWASDIWSLGCMLYELLMLQVPFDAPNINVLLNKIINRQPPQVSYIYSSAIRRLCLDCLNREWRLRPTAAEILQRDIIKNEIRSMLLEQHRKRTLQQRIVPISEPSVCNLNLGFRPKKHLLPVKAHASHRFQPFISDGPQDTPASTNSRQLAKNATLSQEQKDSVVSAPHADTLNAKKTESEQANHSKVPSVSSLCTISNLNHDTSETCKDVQPLVQSSGSNRVCDNRPQLGIELYNNSMNYFTENASNSCCVQRESFSVNGSSHSTDNIPLATNSNELVSQSTDYVPTQSTTSRKVSSQFEVLSEVQSERSFNEPQDEHLKSKFASPYLTPPFYSQDSAWSRSPQKKTGLIVNRICKQQQGGILFSSNITVSCKNNMESTTLRRKPNLKLLATRNRLVKKTVYKPCSKSNLNGSYKVGRSNLSATIKEKPSNSIDPYIINLSRSPSISLISKKAVTKALCIQDQQQTPKTFLSKINDKTVRLALLHKKQTFVKRDVSYNKPRLLRQNLKINSIICCNSDTDSITLKERTEGNGRL